jgi:hypothetical protein
MSGKESMNECPAAITLVIRLDKKLTIMENGRDYF